jgi:AraC-like DNA-binding protein
MQLNLNPASGHNFSFSASLPPGFEGSILRGSNVLTATDPKLGQIVQQELSNSHYTIRLYLFDFLKPFRLKVFQPGSALASILAIRNNLDYRIEGMKKLRLNHGQFALLHTGGRPATLHLNKTKPHEVMEIAWTDAWLKPLLLIPKFDFLRPLFTHAQAGKSFFLRPHPRPAGAMALDTVQDILQSPFDADTSRLLFESHTKEYLILLLIESAKKANARLQLSERDREILIAIGEQVKTNHSKKFSISELSRQAGMSATKFKRGFKEIFGNSVGRIAMTARMHEARRLLMEGLSVKEVKEKVSYKTSAGFIKQFHRFFGYWPSEIQ